MTLVWIVAGVAAVAALATRIVWPFKRRNVDLGFVSQQWLVEHRSYDTSERLR
jgi:hypothetical protein